MKDKNLKVAVGLSGGVDSSVSLLLLKKQGYQPIGVSLKYAAWQGKKNILRENICCSPESLAIAKKICQKLKVPYYVIDERLDFEEKVMGYFLSVLKEKKTPNPCLICNRLLKFNKLFDFAKEKGAQYVATGHYARVKDNKLLRAKDKKKDQSYFLCILEQSQLKDIIFPLGNLTKEKVYQIAKKEGFDFFTPLESRHNKAMVIDNKKGKDDNFLTGFTKTKQSQNLCFVSQQSIPFYLEEKIGFQPGEVIDIEDNPLGKHQGLHFYTIGQRKGIKLSNGPWWVIGFNKKKNQLIVTNKENDPALFSRTIVVSDLHFISGKAPKRVIKIEAKTRFSQPAASAKLYPLKKNKLELVFDCPQKAVTPGQWAVFYQKDVCLGGGVIL